VDRLNQIVLKHNIRTNLDPGPIPIQEYLGNTVRQGLESLSHKVELQQAAGGFVSVVIVDPDSLAAVGIADAYVKGLRTVTTFFIEKTARITETKLAQIERRLAETKQAIVELERFLTTRRQSIRDSVSDRSSKVTRAAEDYIRSLEAQLRERKAGLLQKAEQDLRSAEDSLVSVRTSIRGQEDDQQSIALEQELARTQRSVTYALEFRERLKRGYHDTVEVWNNEDYNKLLRVLNLSRRDLQLARQNNSGGEIENLIKDDSELAARAREIVGLLRLSEKLAGQKESLQSATPHSMREINVLLLSRHVTRAAREDYRYSPSSWLTGGLLAGLGVGTFLAFLVEFVQNARRDGRFVIDDV
jgi:hypothetical protein